MSTMTTMGHTLKKGPRNSWNNALTTKEIKVLYSVRLTLSALTIVAVAVVT